MRANGPRYMVLGHEHNVNLYRWRIVSMPDDFARRFQRAHLIHNDGKNKYVNNVAVEYTSTNRSAHNGLTFASVHFDSYVTAKVGLLNWFSQGG